MWGVRKAAAAVVESLEARALLSAVPLTIAQTPVWDGTQLRIIGTPANDQITVTQTSDGLVIGNSGGWSTTVAGAFANILIDAGAGNDSVVVDPSVTTDCIIYGGAGNDTLLAGSGNDRLYSGAGKNYLKAGTGDDVLDTLGSTRDTLVGGGGHDSFWTDANASAERILNLTPDEVAAGAVHRVGSFYAGPGMKPRQTLVKALSVRALPEPGTDGEGTYANYSNHPLFSASGPSQDDVIQGNIGDCYFLASLAATAKIDPSRLRQGILDMGDGTYLVQFSRGNSKVFVRVDGQLPTLDGSSLEYADFGGGGSIWAPIMEKAFAVYRTGANSYLSLSGGWMDEAFTALGGTSSSVYDVSNGTMLLSQIQRDLAAGKAVAFGTSTITDGAPLLGSHAYTVEQVITDANGTPTSVVMRNPWGIDGAGNDGSDDGYVTVTAAQAFDALLGFSAATV